MAGLSRKISSEGKDYYILAGYYGDISKFKDVQEYLEDKKLNFFEAMKFVSGNMFLRFYSNTKNRKNRW